MTKFNSDTRTLRSVADHLERFVESTQANVGRLGRILEVYCTQIGADQKSKDFSREFVILNQAFITFSREAMSLRDYLMSRAAHEEFEPGESGYSEELPVLANGGVPVLLSRLLETIALLESDSVIIRQIFAELGDYWNDAAFFRFHQAFTAGTKAIARFVERSQSFINHLDQLSQKIAA